MAASLSPSSTSTASLSQAGAALGEHRRLHDAGLALRHVQTERERLRPRGDGRLGLADERARGVAELDHDRRSPRAAARW